MEGIIFDTQGWKTPNSYSNDFAPLPRSSGVYVILRPVQIKNRKNPSGVGIIHHVLYIGMSINIAQRISQHTIKRELNRRGDYVQIWFQRVPKHRLRTRERRLIKRYNPPYNLQHRVRGVA